MGEVRNESSQSAGLMDKLRNGAASQLGVQKDRATEGVSSVAQAVRQSTQQLRDNRHETIAQYVEQAVDRVEQFADRLKEKDVDELVRDAQQFARRNPALFVGAAFGVGVVAARFLKSSSRHTAASGGSWRERTNVSGAYASATRSGGTMGADVIASAPSMDDGSERF
jgi:ElaB/YqjD/DUF883 family membrane-anchored ribosome-binding protein